MRCPGGLDQPSCLTDAQIRVVRDEYRGPSDKEGHLLFDGGEPYGSELAWANWLVMPAADAAAPADSYAAGIGLAFLNEMAFMPNHAGKYSLGSVPFTGTMHEQLEQLGGIYNATDPDLSAFAANGGKLIIYHSWADQAISALREHSTTTAPSWDRREGCQRRSPSAGSTWFPVSTIVRAGSPSTATQQRPCSSCLSSSPGSSAEKPPRRSPCLSPRRPPGRMWPLSASIHSTLCSRRRTTTGSTATIIIRSRPASIRPATRFGAPIKANPWSARGVRGWRPLWNRHCEA